MIYVIGDVHWKENLVYKKGICNFFDWLYELVNKENSDSRQVDLIFLGDFYDTTKPHNVDVIDLSISKLKDKYRSIHILTGNHEIIESGSVRKGNPLEVIKNIKGFNVYTSWSIVEIDKIKCLFLPYLYNLSEMKRLYENGIEAEIDYVFGHFSHPLRYYSLDDSIDYSKSKIKAKYYVYGHIHKFEVLDKNHIILGVPVCTRKGEDLFGKKILRIDTNSSCSIIDVPEFVKYEKVKFGEYPKDKMSLISVIDAPSVVEARNMYSDYYIYDIKTLESQVSYIEYKDDINLSLESMFAKFVNDTKPNIDDQMNNIIQTLFSEIRS